MPDYIWYIAKVSICLIAFYAFLHTSSEELYLFNNQ